MLTAVLGMTGAVVAAGIGAWAVLRARRPAEAKLELVGVSVRSWFASGVLDVKLCNRGGRLAVLTRLNLQVEDGGRFPDYRAQLTAALTPSETYDVMLPPPERVTGASVVKDLSLVILPGEAERFLVRVRATPPVCAKFVYQIRLELIYDAADRRVSSRPFAVVFTNPMLMVKCPGTHEGPCLHRG